MKTRSFRIDAKDEEALKRLGVNLSDLIRNVVKSIIKNKQCPTCGQKLKGGKSELE